MSLKWLFSDVEDLFTKTNAGKIISEKKYVYNEVEVWEEWKKY